MVQKKNRFGKCLYHHSEWNIAASNFLLAVLLKWHVWQLSNPVDQSREILTYFSQSISACTFTAYICWHCNIYEHDKKRHLRVLKQEMSSFINILVFMSGGNFVLSCVEHEKSFIISGPKPFAKYLLVVCAQR